MRATTAALCVLGAASGAFATLSTTVTYSTAYDVGKSSLATVACSDGKNGLLRQGYTTFDSLPRFPYIGGAHDIPGWNSSLCGSCWNLDYKGKTVIIQAVDASPGQGFNIAKQAMDELTNGEGIHLGSVEVTYTRLDAGYCLNID